MRLGATLLFYKGYCYQSFQWQFMRPLGSLQTAVNSLEQYGFDEICIIRPVRDDDDPAIRQSDLDQLRNLDCLTPISLGGGIRRVQDISDLATLPVERFILSSAFIRADTALLEAMNAHFGRQAVQALLPVSLSKNSELKVYCCQEADEHTLTDASRAAIAGYANEIILYDRHNEGLGNFEMALITHSQLPLERLIISGGVGRSEYRALRELGGAAMLIENRALHHEFSKDRFMHD